MISDLLASIITHQAFFTNQGFVYHGDYNRDVSIPQLCHANRLLEQIILYKMLF